MVRGQPIDPTYRQNVLVPGGASAGPIPKAALRKAQLALGIAALLIAAACFGSFVTATVIRGHAGEGLGIAAGILFVFWWMTMVAQSLVSSAWLYRMWAWFPPEQRHTKLWKKYISPSMAVGLMFVPYFNIYWMFVIYLGIGDVFDRMRVVYPTREPFKKELAMATLIVPMFFFPAGPFLHYFLDAHVEALAEEMETRMNRPL